MPEWERERETHAPRQRQEEPQDPDGHPNLVWPDRALRAGVVSADLGGTLPAQPSRRARTPVPQELSAGGSSLEPMGQPTGAENKSTGANSLPAVAPGRAQGRWAAGHK